MGIGTPASIEQLRKLILEKADFGSLVSELCPREPDRVHDMLFLRCMTDDPASILDRTVDLSALRKIADELGIIRSNNASRKDLIANILERMGFYPMKLFGLSNAKWKLANFQESCHLIGNRSKQQRDQELADMVRESAAIIEKDVMRPLFLVYCTLLFPLLNSDEQEKITNLGRSGGFASYLDKLIQLDNKIVSKETKLQEMLYQVVGRKSIFGGELLVKAREAYNLRSKNIAHNRISGGTADLLGLAEKMINLSLQTIADLDSRKIFPGAILQVWYEQDEWGRAKIYFLQEKDFDMDGQPSSNSGKFERDGTPRIHKCKLMFAGIDYFRPRITCYTFQEPKNGEYLDPPPLFFIDKISRFEQFPGSI